MANNSRDNFVTIKRKGILHGNIYCGYHSRPFVENKERSKVKVEDREIEFFVDSDNTDIFYAARNAGYNREEEFEYEIRIPIKK